VYSLKLKRFNRQLTIDEEKNRWLSLFIRQSRLAAHAQPVILEKEQNYIMEVGYEFI